MTSQSFSPPPGLEDAVSTACGLLRGLGNGGRAELRRADVKKPYTSTLWRLMLQLPPECTRLEHEQPWGLLLGAMVQSREFSAESAEAAGPPLDLGEALFDADFSELRLTRLLRADEDAFPEHFRRMANILAHKSVRPKWWDVARLVFSTPESPEGTNERRRIARHYFAAEFRHNKKS